MFKTREQCGDVGRVDVAEFSAITEFISGGPSLVYDRVIRWLKKLAATELTAFSVEI